MKPIIIQGARENNLKNISLEIPKNKITVFTGVSGSGKSSLVFETIGAEAQRQINETYDSFIRSRMPHYGNPDVDKIDNLNVAIIINQKRLGGSARSTVGTVTDIYSLLRLLFARLGKPFVGYSMVFSFNNPKGMCQRCEGLGKISEINIEKLIDKNKSLNEGAIRFPTFQPNGWRWQRYAFSGYFNNNKKLKEFTKDEWKMLLYAEEHKPSKPHRNWGKTVLYEGVIPRIEKGFLKKDSTEYNRNAADLQEVIYHGTCPECKGARLNKTVLSCKIKGRNIADCSNMQINELISFLQDLQHPRLETVIQELIAKLGHLVDIGLHYLCLSRETSSLSGGESQRIKLVKHLGGSLSGLMYIFDEPSIGLHPADLDRLNQIILRLRDKGNTILIVEHDPDVIAIADHVVDMGPHAGRDGGEIMYEGTVKGLLHARGATAEYWQQQRSINRTPRQPQGWFTIKNAALHNLKNLTVAVPEKVITVVVGVAGSGKSSLINQVLPQQFPNARLIDQSLLRGSKRSHLASYTGIFDKIRKLFASANKVSASLFSANAEGACPECNGLGIITLDLAFMDDVEQTCDVCGGSGFNREALKYQYNGKTIAEVLDMDVSEAKVFFTDPVIFQLMQKLEYTGLSYITLGQPLNTFSGGERQRLKLAMELDETGKLFVFDEPTTGLHPSDIAKIMRIFNELAEQGNTVVIVEHNLDVIAQADWLIEIGPGAGSEGGQSIFEGTAADLAKAKTKTAQYLKSYVNRTVPA